MRNNTFKDNVLRVVAVLGLIAVLLLGAWGIIQLAFWLPSLFGGVTGNIGGIFKREPAPATLTIALPVGVTAGTPFTLSWSHNNATGAHGYALAYQCRDGVTFDALQGGKTTKIVCNTPFTLTGSSSVQLTARLAAATKATPVGVSVAATNAAGTIVATSTGGTVVSPAAAATTTPAKPKPASTTKPASTYYASGRTQNLYGLPDLHVAMNSAYSQSGRAVAQFTVSNIGTNVSPANWSFTALLPINGGYTYQSPAQQALYPGDRIVFTMGYDSVGNYGQNCGQYNQGGYGYTIPCYDMGGNYGGQQNVTVTVDPYGMIAEMSKANNSASRSYWGN